MQSASRVVAQKPRAQALHVRHRVVLAEPRERRGELAAVVRGMVQHLREPRSEHELRRVALGVGVLDGREQRVVGRLVRELDPVVGLEQQARPLRRAVGRGGFPRGAAVLRRQRPQGGVFTRVIGMVNAGRGRAGQALPPQALGAEDVRERAVDRAEEQARVARAVRGVG